MSDNILQLIEQDGLQAAISPEPILEAADITFTFSYDQENDEGIPHLHVGQEAPTPLQPLTAEEQHLLENCEKEIDEGMAGFYAVGKHLHIIKTKKLYRAKYKTFTEYCDKEWSISRVHANRQIEASQTIDDLKSEPIGTVPLPLNESQARALSGKTKEEKIAAAKKLKQKLGDRKPVTNDWLDINDEGPTDKAKGGKAVKAQAAKETNILQLHTKQDAADKLVEMLDDALSFARENNFPQTVATIKTAIKSVETEKQQLMAA